MPERTHEDPDVQKGFQEPCHGASVRKSKARLLHRARYATIMRLRERELLTADERSFRNAKLRRAFLISDKTVADLAGTRRAVRDHDRRRAPAVTGGVVIGVRG